MIKSEYSGLSLERRANGVLVVTIQGQDKLNSLGHEDHTAIGDIWFDIAGDRSIRAVVITGAGNAFCAGGNLDIAARNGGSGNYNWLEENFEASRAIIHNLVNLETPVISAINGPIAGAGLAVGLLADISIMDEDASLADGHVRIGVTAGDHAALIWPLLCSIAQAKYYLLTGDRMSGREAAQMGIVSKALPAAEVLPRALQIADRLAEGPQTAIRWTKRALNQWLRQALPMFDASLGWEMAQMFSPDFVEGATAFREQRKPRWR
ncbi:enoyl-CoA hydratase/isomerase family protein [Salinibacterium sp. ZJ454]|uniref:enoyl-CoA hydratase/isomerase family protein n=1 Tax=Salinibacterium sp. ZJ454 TaxID=2708339 RepID=UPI001422C566|nr:enoyl-CoA hydratase/isomerase family protein [Salinibacterium sp. ZJ454]